MSASASWKEAQNEYERGEWTFPIELLYILDARDNDTGLGPEHARRIVGSLCLLMRNALYSLHVPEVTIPAIVQELDLLRPMEQEPLHPWEKRIASIEELLGECRQLRAELDEANMRAREAARRVIELESPGIFDALPPS